MVAPALLNLLAVSPRIIIYTATEGYRHESIEIATAALFQLGQEHNIHFDHTEDRRLFNDKNLAKYDALLFLNNNDEGALFDYHPDLQPAIDGRIRRKFTTFAKIPVTLVQKFYFRLIGIVIKTTPIELKPKDLLIQSSGIKNGALELKIRPRLVEVFTPVWGI
ncbi:hypothetical protein OPQ81_008157 [Rhizoctonia solani]|nr:hypothetical protein OPQ81_008157 [Rhizoctonia solani]